MHPRPDRRKPSQLRPLRCQWNVAPNALASVLLSCGDTQVICAVSVEENVPRWMKAQNVSGGWLTAEYSMLPYSTADRKPRDITKGKIDGRSQEIQRLIGRSLRAVLDLEKLGPRTLWVDCDVLQADGGTRTTSITGAYLALRMAVERLMLSGRLTDNPLTTSIAAVSVGIVSGRVLADLCYLEDKNAAVDMNVVMTGGGRFVEVQASGEEASYTPDELHAMLAAASSALKKTARFQTQAWARRPAQR
ncbi:MAG: ribonuclease PH [Verrucomicrobiales bacterium]|jgi:ribonuclease PH|nr:ribonuclease PH [Verrucomicrobiales bacterium]